MAGLRFYNCGTHKVVAQSYTYILKTDITAYESMRSIVDYYGSYDLGDFSWVESSLKKAKLYNIEFFTGKCFAIDAPDSDNYIYFGISWGLYISIFQIWHTSTDLITNVLGRKIVYKAKKKREGQGKEELWTQEKNYKYNMREDKGANIDVAIHGVWCDSINRSGFCSSENVNQRQFKNFNVVDINNKLIKINYDTFDFEYEKNSLLLLRKQDWKLSIAGGDVFTLKFKENTKYVQGTFENGSQKGKVTGNILDCYLSFNIILQRDDEVLQQLFMAVCEWSPTLTPKHAIIVSTRGIQGEATLSIC
ncbi:predicted protein [Naegleria gruberi]|uniref:Predicted protein n=1 Tax=Naegleria gruberi TaxID=5762 RepID=D2VVQ3_NAEGR|nr:uncharacterized protein NAEGRDRAFT_73103 [Naegleria gruberi]EFC39144.1 predicted protein [Naegleria gruberi]|eukprot:XP_002671888.1 predicted protein [Naegleria gruberi strain NEG-M]